MPISDKLIDQLLEGCDSPDDILGEAGVFKQLTKKVAERALNAEMEQHLGYAKHALEGKNSGNSRNGKTSKKIRSVHGEIELDIPRDRNGSFEPVDWHQYGASSFALNGATILAANGATLFAP